MLSDRVHQKLARVRRRSVPPIAPWPRQQRRTQKPPPHHRSIRCRVCSVSGACREIASAWASSSSKSAGSRAPSCTSSSGPRAGSKPSTRAPRHPTLWANPEPMCPHPMTPTVGVRSRRRGRTAVYSYSPERTARSYLPTPRSRFRRRAKAWSETSSVP